MIKIIKYFFQSIFIYSFFLFGRLLGIGLSRKIFLILFRLLGPIFKSKKIIKKNLRTFSKDISKSHEDSIIKAMWGNYGMTFIEYIFLKELREKTSHIEIEGETNILNLSKGNKPVIFISGHFANFELMSMEITKRNIKLATIYRPLNNFFINPFMEYMRKKYVCRNQIKKGLSGVKEAIEFIKKKHSIALMIDQRVSEGKKINFFGKSALTTSLPAQLAIKYSLGIIPVFIERTKNNKFKIRFYEEIDPKNFKNKIDLTQKLNYVLEDMITKNPYQWIWTHNRWK